MDLLAGFFLVTHAFKWFIITSNNNNVMTHDLSANPVTLKVTFN